MLGRPTTRRHTRQLRGLPVARRRPWRRTGAFASVCTITRGTGDWAGATGHITYGTFTLAEGGNSHYEGLISR